MSAEARAEDRVMPATARDRRFLRDVYDGGRVLARMSDAVRRHPSRPDLLLDEIAQEIRQWLYTRTVAVFLREDSWPGLEPEPGPEGRRLRARPGKEGPDYLLYRLRPVGGESGAPARTGRDPEGNLGTILERASAAPGGLLELDEGVASGGMDLRLVVPLVTGGRVLGYLCLGGKRSGEPYSRVDAQLLKSAAEQVAVALDHSRLLERITRQRLLEREIEIAREVQSRLLPREWPELRSLELTATCVQARAVGGDYYDFLAPEPGRLGIVLADIAGKGISAALLMAGLQAHLRSQYALFRDDLVGLVGSVNRQFCRAIGSSRYATVFLGQYDDETGRLRYVNCGHLPPILLRAGGRVERLPATGTVLGAFPEWTGGLGETRLAPGDTLIVFSDGITEASDESGEEFGDARLLAALRAAAHGSAADVDRELVAAARSFAGGKPADDMTLVVARGVQPVSDPDARRVG